MTIARSLAPATTLAVLFALVSGCELAPAEEEAEVSAEQDADAPEESDGAAEPDGTELDTVAIREEGRRCIVDARTIGGRTDTVEVCASVLWDITSGNLGPRGAIKARQAGTRVQIDRLEFLRTYVDGSGTGQTTTLWSGGPYRTGTGYVYKGFVGPWCYGGSRHKARISWSVRHRDGALHRGTFVAPGLWLMGGEC